MGRTEGIICNIDRDEGLLVELELASSPHLVSQNRSALGMQGIHMRSGLVLSKAPISDKLFPWPFGKS